MNNLNFFSNNQIFRLGHQIDKKVISFEVEAEPFLSSKPTRALTLSFLGKLGELNKDKEMTVSEMSPHGKLNFRSQRCSCAPPTFGNLGSFGEPFPPFPSLEEPFPSLGSLGSLGI
jgi:hypothetical protein